MKDCVQSLECTPSSKSAPSFTFNVLNSQPAPVWFSAADFLDLSVTLSQALCFHFDDDGINLARVLGCLLTGWNTNGLRKIPHSLELELSLHEAHNRRAEKNICEQEKTKGQWQLQICPAERRYEGSYHSAHHLFIVCMSLWNNPSEGI